MNTEGLRELSCNMSPVVSQAGLLIPLLLDLMLLSSEIIWNDYAFVTQSGIHQYAMV